MRIFKLSSNLWVWSFRLQNQIGQAYGEAVSREEALKQCLKRIKEGKQ